MRFLRLLFLFVFCFTGVTPALSASLINDTETERVITDLIKPLAKAANIPENRMSVHIVNDDSFNAFVMGGEDVYIYTGLLTRIKNPNALQAVVAHEMGHMLGGHMVQMSERMAAEMKRSLLIQALGVGLMVAGGNPSLGAGVMAGASGVARQSLLSFSRDEERIADDMGVDLMVRAGLNPNGFIDVFEQMNEMSGHIETKVNPNAVNHPLTMERLKNVREKISKLNLKKINKNSKDEVAKYTLVRAKLIGYLDEMERVKTLYPYSDKTDAAIYARAIANMRGGNLSGALVGVKTLISRDAKNPYFYELLGDLEYQYGHYDDSVRAYEKSLNLANNAPQIQTALALVLTERNKPNDKERAIDLCKRSLLTNASPLAYWVLAKAYGSDDGRADWAMAEFYNMQKQPKKTKEYARRAKNKLPPKSPEYIKSVDLLK
ncbi:MAG: M48 family metalloprotease [Alphaproteobacteria bacterium]|nr:M48 family metalloprotease [Alphaproteobacteria bacterium]